MECIYLCTHDIIDYNEKNMNSASAGGGGPARSAGQKKTKNAGGGRQNAKTRWKNKKKAGWGAGIAQKNKNKCETNRIIELSLERNALFLKRVNGTVEDSFFRLKLGFRVF